VFLLSTCFLILVLLAAVPVLAATVTCPLIAGVVGINVRPWRNVAKAVVCRIIRSVPAEPERM